MLRYNEENIVEFIKPADSLPASMELKKEYKGDPDVLQKILVYVYNVYSPESIYAEFPPEERKDRICMNLFDNKVNKEDFDNNNKVKDFVALYIEMTWTVTQREHERTKKDIEELREYISSIPWAKRKKVKQFVDFINPENPEQITSKEVEAYIDIDNSEEKIKAISVGEKLYLIDQRLRKIVEVEKIEKELTAKTMFEEQ